jgi:hypothetical protein
VRETEFKDSEFMTATEKKLVLARWKRFVEGGFQEPQFTDRIYKHLSLRAEFIAHFSREGFYQTYFEDPEATIRFLRQFDADHGFLSVEYQSDRWIRAEYADINRAMSEVLESRKERLYAELSGKVIQRDLSAAEALLAKHGIKVVLQQVEI